jgi:hypothetical protein
LAEDLGRFALAGQILGDNVLPEIGMVSIMVPYFSPSQRVIFCVVMCDVFEMGSSKTVTYLYVWSIEILGSASDLDSFLYSTSVVQSEIRQGHLIL